MLCSAARPDPSHSTCGEQQQRPSLVVVVHATDTRDDDARRATGDMRTAVGLAVMAVLVVAEAIELAQKNGGGRRVRAKLDYD